MVSPDSTATLSVQSAITACVRLCACVLCCGLQWRSVAANARISSYCMSTLPLHPELSSDPEKVEKDFKHQGSMVSDARSFVHKQLLVTTHPGVTYASSLTM